MSSNPRITVKEGRDGSLWRHHPWIFSGTIGSVEGNPASGETVEVYTVRQQMMGRAAYSPKSQLAARMWSFESEEEIDADFFRRRLERAIRARPDDRDRGVRLVNAESDGLPGLIVDRYADHLVVEILTAGAEHWRETIYAILNDLVGPAGIWERSDVDVREKEGLKPRVGLIDGDEPPQRIEIAEGPCRFLVDVREGHKTGFYLDQRDNRQRVGAASEGLDVLNGFAYTGGFGLHALAGGASSLTNIESSEGLLGELEANVELNGFETDRVENLQGDVFSVLRTFRDSRRDFDLIVLDPPKFAESKVQVKPASRGYKDINLLACKLLRPGGMLYTFSCSAHVGIELFQKIVAGAALDSGRHAQIVGRMTQAPDHPVALEFPEGAYLKGLVVRVD